MLPCEHVVDEVDQTAVFQPAFHIICQTRRPYNYLEVLLAKEQKIK